MHFYNSWQIEGAVIFQGWMCNSASQYTHKPKVKKKFKSSAFQRTALHILVLILAGMPLWKSNQIKCWLYSILSLARAGITRQVWPEKNKNLPKKITFSPISVWSPPGSTSRSVFKAQTSRAFWYFSSLRAWPNKMLSFSVAFRIQACWGT